MEAGRTHNYPAESLPGVWRVARLKYRGINSGSDPSLLPITLADQFDGLFAGEVLDVETDDQHACEAVFEFLLQGFVLVGVVAVAKQAGGGQFLSLVVDNMDPAEGDDASEESGVHRGLYVVLRHNAERCPVAAAYGVDLVAGQRAVEIEFALAEDIADGDRVGIAPVAKQGQSARSGFLQNCIAIFVRKLLAFTPHLPEFHSLSILLFRLLFLPQRYT